MSETLVVSSEALCFDLAENLHLGDYPAALATLSQLVAERPPSDDRIGRLAVRWSSGSLDLTLLAHFSQLLRRARQRFAQVDLHLAGPMLDKQVWLADCGFWDYVAGDGKENGFRCQPDWHALDRPPGGSRTACAPLFVLPVASDDPAAMAPEDAEETVADFAAVGTGA